METKRPSDGTKKRLAIAAAVAAPVVLALAAAERLNVAEPLPSASESERARIAHLLRRAGFGASRLELDAAVSRGYDATLDQLLEPRDAQDDAKQLAIIEGVGQPNPQYSHFDSMAIWRTASCSLPCRIWRPTR